MESHTGQRGFALILALALLALFTLLAAAYLRFMSIEAEEANVELRRTRAQTLAEAGMRAAIADLAEWVREDSVRGRLPAEPRVYDFQTYLALERATAAQLGPDVAESRTIFDDERRLSQAKVWIADESGKLNLNHARVSVLQYALDLSGAQAREIVMALPHREGEGRWLVAPEDLVDRGLLSQEDFEQLDRSRMTTYTVLDHDAPRNFLNINTAPLQVLAAVLDIPVRAAEGIDAATIAAQRPFKDFEALLEAVGRDPATFKVAVDPQNPQALPAELTLKSRCFRLTSKGTYATVKPEGGLHRPASAYAEAVVLFEDDGCHQIVYWTLSPNPQAFLMLNPAEEAAATAEDVAPEAAAEPAGQEEDEPAPAPAAAEAGTVAPDAPAAEIIEDGEG